MRIRIVRTGLFLLFAVLVSVVAPLQPAMSADLAMRNPAELKSEVKENRDAEKLRQRPASTAPGRREQRRPDLGTPLPRSVHHALPGGFPRHRAIALPARLSGKPHDDAARSRHAPATLQVYRH